MRIGPISGAIVALILTGSASLAAQTNTQAPNPSISGTAGAMTCADFTKMDATARADFMKQVVEAALNAELTHHLGYEKHEEEGRNTGNSRNGHYPKKLKTRSGELEFSIPRDRTATFEPQLIEKGQRRFTAFDAAFWNK